MSWPLRKAEIGADDEADVVEFEALAGVDATYLVDGIGGR